MPIYDYNCPTCGVKEDIWAGVSEQLKICDDCGNIMKRMLPLCSVICDIEPYLDPHFSSQEDTNPVLVKSRQHKNQLLKERGLVQK